MVTKSINIIKYQLFTVEKANINAIKAISLYLTSHRCIGEFKLAYSSRTNFIYNFNLITCKKNLVGSCTLVLYLTPKGKRQEARGKNTAELGLNPLLSVIS